MSGKEDSVKFRTTILRNDKTATGIPVPPEVLASLGSGKRPPVRVTINGYTYRTTVATVDGQYMVGVSADVREKAGVAGGDEVDVDIELDTEPREVTVPPDFAQALDSDAEARRFFDGLSYSNRRRFVLSIEEAKTPETRQRRIDKAVSTLERAERSPIPIPRAAPSIRAALAHSSGRREGRSLLKVGSMEGPVGATLVVALDRCVCGPGNHAELSLPLPLLAGLGHSPSSRASRSRHNRTGLLPVVRWPPQVLNFVDPSLHLLCEDCDHPKGE